MGYKSGLRNKTRAKASARRHRDWREIAMNQWAVGGYSTTDKLITAQFGSEPSGTQVPDSFNTGSARSIEQGQAYDFDGVDDVVTIPHSDDLTFGDGTNDQPFSITFWVDSSNYTTRYIFGKSNASSDREYLAYLDGSRRLRLQLYDGISGNNIYAHSTNSLTNDTVTFCAVTYDGGGANTGITIKFYEAGVEGAGAEVTGSAGSYTAMNGDTGTEQYIGGLDANPNYDGKIWDVRVHNKELSTSEIEALVADPNSTTGHEVGWWKLDEGAGNTAFDSSENGNNHGAISGHTPSTFFSTQDVVSFQNEDGYGVWGRNDGTVTGAEVDLDTPITYDGEFDITTVFAFTDSYTGYIAGVSSSYHIRIPNASTIRVTCEGNQNDFTVPTFEWGVAYTLRITRDSSDDMRLYLNGVESSTGAINETSDLSISALLNRGTSGTASSIWMQSYSDGTGLWRAKNNWQDEIGSNNGTATADITSPKVPAKTATTDVFGESLTYSGVAPKHGALVQSNCGTFDGVDDKIAFPSLVTLSGAFEISYWMYNDGAGTDYDVVTGYNNSSKITSGAATNTFFVRIINAGASDSTVSNAGTVGVWTHVRLTRDADDKVDLYINGGTANRLYGDVAQSGDSEWEDIGEGGGTVRFEGKIADFKIIDNGTTIVHYPLAEGAGLIAFDVSGNDNHGTISGATSAQFWANTQDVYHYNITEGFGEWADFSLATAVDDSYTIESGTGDFSLEIDLINNSTATHAIVGMSSSISYVRWQNSGADVRVNIGSTGYIFSGWTISGDITTLKIERISDEVTVYQDDVAIAASQTASGDFTITKIGNRAGGTAFDGMIKEVRGTLLTVTASELVSTGTDITLSRVPIGTLSNPSGSYHNGAETKWKPNPDSDPKQIYQNGITSSTVYSHDDGFVNPEFMDQTNIKQNQDYLQYMPTLTTAEFEAVFDNVYGTWSPSQLSPMFELDALGGTDISAGFSYVWKDTQAGYNIMDGESDFSVDKDPPFSTSNLLTTTTYNESIGGKTGLMKIVPSADQTSARVGVRDTTQFTVGKTYRIEYSFFLPATNTNWNGISIRHSSATPIVNRYNSGVGEWFSGVTYYTSDDNEIYVYLTDGSSTTPDSDADGDECYMEYFNVYESDGIDFHQIVSSSSWPSYASDTITFDGINDYLSMPVDSSNFQDLTYFEYWTAVQLDSTNLHYSLAFNDNGGSDTNRLLFYGNTDNTIRVYCQDNSGSSDSIKTDDTFSDGWHIVGFIADGSAWSLVVNGVVQATSAVTGSNTGLMVGDMASNTLIDIASIASQQDSTDNYVAMDAKYGLGITTATTEAERTMITNYIKARFGI